MCAVLPRTGHAHHRRHPIYSRRQAPWQAAASEVIILAGTDMAIRKAQGSEQGSEQGSGRRLQGMEHLRQTLCADPGPEEVAPVDAIRDVGGEAPAGEVQAGGGPSGVRQRIPRRAWTSLKEKHLKLRDEGYEPPPVKEWEAVYVAHDGRSLSNGRKLRENDVRWIRENPDRLSIKERAERLGVTYQAVMNVAKGISHKRYNLKYPPRL